MRPTEADRPTLTIGSALRDTLIAEAKAGLPFETCGALLGSWSNTDALVTRRVALANRARNSERSYSIDPADLEPLLRTDSVVGFYHSHPDCSASFSAVDTRLAWPGWWYVIVGVGSDRAARLAAWRDGLPATLRR